MRVIEMQEYGGPEVLREVDRPEPVAGPDQVRVRVRAATVNPVDWLTREGALAGMVPHLQPPFVLGWDLAGVVEAGAHGLEAGQRVVGMIPWFVAGTGSYAEVVVADPAWLAPLPDHLDDVLAAALPLNGLTARQALDLLDLRARQTLLVTGASGGVGGYAVQLAAAAGAHVIAVASRGDEAYVSGLGAKEVLGRAEPADLVGALRSVAPDGADAVLDAAPAGSPLLGAARDGGAFVTVLAPEAPAPERGVRVDKVSVAPDPAQLRTLTDALAGGGLVTRVAATLPLTQAAEAHRRAAAGGLRGKVVLTL